MTPEFQKELKELCASHRINGFYFYGFNEQASVEQRQGLPEEALVGVLQAKAKYYDANVVRRMSGYMVSVAPSVPGAKWDGQQ